MRPVQQVGVGACAHQAALLKQRALKQADLRRVNCHPGGNFNTREPRKFITADIQVKEMQRQIARVLLA